MPAEFIENGRGFEGIPGGVDGGVRGQRSEVAGIDVPLVMMSAFQYSKTEPKYQPQLPSHPFRYTVWHELKSTSLTGDQLKAPRVRNGPDVKEKSFHSVRDSEGQLIHHSKSGKERKEHQHQLENWENSLTASLPYQDLSHSYQKKNFNRILKRLIRVVRLNLAHNDLIDLSSFAFPRCEDLNLNNNYLSSFTLLPKTPNITCLTMTFNDINNLRGLDRLAKSPIRSLNLCGNPVTFTANYRQRVFEILPNLQVLDSIPKLKSDEVFEEDERSCVIL